MYSCADVVPGNDALCFHVESIRTKGKQSVHSCRCLFVAVELCVLTAAYLRLWKDCMLLSCCRCTIHPSDQRCMGTVHRPWSLEREMPLSVRKCGRRQHGSWKQAFLHVTRPALEHIRISTSCIRCQFVEVSLLNPRNRSVSYLESFHTTTIVCVMDLDQSNRVW